MAAATILTGGVGGVVAGVAIAAMFAAGTMQAANGVSKIVEGSTGTNPTKQAFYGGNSQAYQSFDNTAWMTTMSSAFAYDFVAPVVDPIIESRTSSVTTKTTYQSQGSTASRKPETLNEQLSLEQVKSDPLTGA